MSSREGQTHDEKGGGFGLGRRLWLPWPPTLPSLSLFLFWSRDEQRLTRSSALSSFCAKNPTFFLLTQRTKEQVPCPALNTSITKVSVIRNSPPQAQAKPGAAAGTVGLGSTRTLRHLCQHGAGERGYSCPQGLIPSRKGENLSMHNHIICIHFDAHFPMWRDLSANKN